MEENYIGLSFGLVHVSPPPTEIDFAGTSGTVWKKNRQLYIQYLKCKSYTNYMDFLFVKIFLYFRMKAESHCLQN